MLTAVRFFLWVIKQATTPPLEEGDKGLPYNIGKFLHNAKRYLGFIVVGIFLGFLLSFFLPDFVGDLARWVWAKVQSALGW